MTIVDHFSKYGFAYAIPDKKAETIRNYMAQAFAIVEFVMLYTDNGEEFVNELLTNCQNKKFQAYIRLASFIHKVIEQLRVLTKLFKGSWIKHTNTLFNGDEEWSLPLMISDFLHFYNSKRTIQQPKWFREIFYSILKTKWLLSK